MTDFVVFRFHRADWETTVAQVFPRNDVRPGRTVAEEVERFADRPVPYVIVKRSNGNRFSALRAGIKRLLKKPATLV